MGAQLALIEAGPQVVPQDYAVGLKRQRRSRALAWRLFVALERAESHDALAAAWSQVIRARLVRSLDKGMQATLARVWERRCAELRLTSKRKLKGAK
ncbi:MAG: hypothetical protein Q8Q09_25695 [Deltaproteobacteria bacterium]|nr:hypothetical protein [Deltaproteobacteria bacterium]